MNAPKPQHPWWSDDYVKWEVRFFDSYDKPTTKPVYVSAPTKERALAAGKSLTRMLGMKRRGTARAKRYFPERDPELLNSAFVRRNVPTGGAA